MSSLAQAHTHDFSYVLLKDAKGRFFGRVLEIPQVVVQASSAEEIEKEIESSTKEYLKAAPKIHQMAFDDELYPQPITSEPCVIVDKKPLTVRC